MLFTSIIRRELTISRFFYYIFFLVLLISHIHVEVIQPATTIFRKTQCNAVEANFK